MCLRGAVCPGTTKSFQGFQQLGPQRGVSASVTMKMLLGMWSRHSGKKFMPWSEKMNLGAQEKSLVDLDFYGVFTNLEGFPSISRPARWFSSGFGGPLRSNTMPKRHYKHFVTPASLA